LKSSWLRKNRVKEYKEQDIENTPSGAARYLKPYIYREVVYDFGCGDGTFMRAMNKYAQDVLGIEKNPMLALKAKSKGLHVINEDFMDFPLHHGMVIYTATNNEAVASLWKKIEESGKKLTLISYHYPIPGKKPDDMIVVPLPHVWLDEFVFLIYNT
jgi:predicted RNA methylase